MKQIPIQPDNRRYPDAHGLYEIVHGSLRFFTEEIAEEVLEEVRMFLNQNALYQKNIPNRRARIKYGLTELLQRMNIFSRIEVEIPLLHRAPRIYFWTPNNGLVEYRLGDDVLNMTGLSIYFREPKK